MSKKPFNVSSIEEDFKKIGISTGEPLTEAKNVKGDKLSSIPKKKAKAVQPDDALAGKSGGRAGAPNEKPEADEPAEESDDSDEDGEPVSEDEAPEGEELTERLRLVRKRRANMKLRKVRRKQKILRRRHKAKLKQKAKRWRKSPRGKRFLRKYKQALKRVHGAPPKGRRISLRSGMDRVSNLVEEVEDIVQAIEESDSQVQAVKSFANLALIANDLAEEFGHACKASKEAAEESKASSETEEGDEQDFCVAAKKMESAAERAADLSEALNAALQEGSAPTIGNDEITEQFAEIVGTVQQGLELYAELTDALEELDTEGAARP
jgi:hypothetical protein